MPSALSAAPPVRGRAKAPHRLSVGFSDARIAYELRLGLPAADPATTMFTHDPEVKEETLRTVETPKVNLLERRALSAMLRDEEGRRVTFPVALEPGESVLSQLAEPHHYPVLSMLRERLRRWRFYHQMRTDADSPMRAVQVGTRTPVLAHDGHDLAAALQTIIEIGDGHALAGAVAEAFDGARVEIAGGASQFALELHAPGVSRPLTAAELSDGTLRYLALVAALLSPRPPELLVLNEPETSLHPSLLAPLAEQIIAAAMRSQILVVTHAEPLVDAISAAPSATRIELAKHDGATVVAGRAPLDAPPWKWTS